MVDLFSDDRLLEIAGGDEAFLSVRLARQLIAARATQEHMRARCVWLQERRKALQRLAATRMVRLRTLRKLRARLSSGPVMPELRWDGDYLRIGKIYVGVVEEEDDCDLCYGCFDDSRIISQVTEPEARAAVEAAVRKALGWEA